MKSERDSIRNSCDVFILTFPLYLPVCDTVTVPKMLNDTDTFFQYQIFSIPIPVFFSVLNLSDTDYDFFPVPNFSDTGSDNFTVLVPIINLQNS